MEWKILYDRPGRMRVHAVMPRMTLAQADVVEYTLAAVQNVKKVTVYDRTCDAVIEYTGSRVAVVRVLARFAFTAENRALVPEHTGRALSRTYEDKLVLSVAGRLLRKLFLPAPIRHVMAVVRAVRYIRRGLKSLLAGKLEVSVLDATAITVSLLRGDLDTASSIMFLLGIGDILEEWTHRRSVEDLAGAMSLGIEKVWLLVDGTEVLTPIGQIAAGDRIVVRTGNMIPLDGRVERGEMAVDQASMTGESEPVEKRPGSLVYAGTAVDAGEAVIVVEQASGSGRYDRIVKMIEESERLKSAVEDKAAHLADRLVPFSLLGTGLTYLLTGNAVKAVSILMVDYSCALKLSMPVAVLSAMREGTAHGITFKGGRVLEAVSQADTIVFDKTGTLTHAAPRVHKIVTFGGADEADMLRIAACLEEHYPHSIANAVVREAARRGIVHEECHSQVEYIVAHGILGTVDGRRVALGSRHFLFEDEHCTVPDEETFAALPEEYSHLYMSVDGVLTAVLLIEDPLREEAPAVIRQLRAAGFSHIVMMTGDSERTARAIARRVGVDRYMAEVLPEDKAAFVRAMRGEGHRVLMVGDGINDTPALSEADAGIAVNSGAAIAREIADVTVESDDLHALLTMKQIADALMHRIHANYRFIMSFNTALILGGVFGLLPPATSALLHNLSTLGIGLRSMTDLLPDGGIAPQGRLTEEAAAVSEKLTEELIGAFADGLPS